MIALHELKTSILSDLKSCEPVSPIPRTGLWVKTFEVERVADLHNLLLHTGVHPCAYLANREKTRFDLALGCSLAIRTKEQSDKLDNLLSDKNIHIFGGQRFDHHKNLGNEWKSFGDFYFFVPRVHFRSEKNSCKVTLTLTSGDLDKDGNILAETFFEIHDCLDFKKYEERATNFKFDHQVPGQEDWSRKISGCLDVFQQNKVQKIVLSRKQVFHTDENTNIKSLILKSKVENNYIFYFQVSEFEAFLSLSPEKLFSISHGLVEVDAIAGSKTRGRDEADDDILEKQLLSDPKELAEHRFVCSAIESNLKTLGLSFVSKKKENILKLPYIQHIHTTYEFPLGKHTKIKSLLDTLHPTPAVGGFPSKEALEIIRSFEVFDRGLYAAPMGMLNKKHSEILVGIRSALAIGKDLHVFGGAGIVQGSKPDQEWSETQNKMKAIQGLFI